MAGGFIALPSKAEADIPNADPGYVNVFSDADAADRPASKDSAGVVDTFEGPAGPAGSNGTNGTNGADGADGADGVGVPVGGTAGQLLAKSSSTDFDTGWVSPAGEDEILDIPTAETDASLVLAPNGAGGVEFRAEAGGGGGLVLLGTYSAAAAATLNALTRNAAGQSGNLFQSDYSAYLIKVLEELLPSAGTPSLQFKFHGGGAYIAANYKASGWAYVNGGTATFGGSGLASVGFSNAADSSTTAGEGGVGTFDIYQPASAIAVKKMEFHYRYIVTGVPKGTEGMNTLYDTTSCDGFQFFMSSGNITGKVAVYGWAS